MTDRPKRLDRRLALIAIGVVAGGAFALAAVYGIGAMQRNPTEAACRPAAETAKRLAPLARGEVGAVGIASDPKRLPELSFIDPDGKPRTLAGFRGKTV